MKIGLKYYFSPIFSTINTLERDILEKYYAFILEKPVTLHK